MHLASALVDTRAAHGCGTAATWPDRAAARPHRCATVPAGDGPICSTRGVMSVQGFVGHPGGGAALMLRAAAIGSAALMACAGAQAQDGGASYDVSAGLVHRRLAEHTPGGGTLLTERGWLPQVRGSVARGLPSGGAIGGALSLAGAPINYNGQTQAGTPLSTRTRQTELA